MSIFNPMRCTVQKPFAAFLVWPGAFAALCIALLGSQSATGQGLEYVKEHYTKYEYRIPMRDGKRLFTAVYAPKDQSQPYPILLTRTPYSVAPYGIDRYKPDLGPSPLAGKAGYIFVFQDVRGRWMSEGEFVDVRPHRPRKPRPTDVDESSDTWDTIEWLLKHMANHNGKVGMWGISYPGYYAAMGMIDAHPALKAVSPQAPISDWFVGDDWHHNGALMLAQAFNFMAVFGHPRPQPVKKSAFTFDHETPDGYQFFLEIGPLANANARFFKDDVPFWNEVMRHGTYDDFWKARNVRPHLKNIRPAVMTVGGWFDAEDLFGALQTYRHIEAGGHGSGNTLVMGPWKHGGWGHDDGESLGPVSFNAKTSLFFRETIEMPFFEFYLKGKGDLKLPKAWVFQTGTNQWLQVQRLAAQGDPGETALSVGRGPAEPSSRRPLTRRRPAYDEYVSDPAKPVPYLNKIAIRVLPEFMAEDQRFAAVASRRPRLPDRRLGGGPGGRRADPGRAFRRHFRDRFRLGRETDRRLPQRLSRSQPEPGGRAHGRVPAIGARRRDAGQVPQQFREARTLRAQPAHRGAIHAAGRLPRLSHRPSAHGPGAEHMVPAGGPQSADLCRHLHGQAVRLPQEHARRTAPAASLRA